MSAKRSRLIEAMHTAAGCQAKSATEWLTLAQTHDALGVALRALYGKRLPTKQKLGRDFTEWAGKAWGDFRLLCIYDSHVKAARYAVETQAESEARERREAERETQREIIDAEKEQRAIGRALRKFDEEEAKKREAIELKALTAAPTIAQAAHTPPPDFETTTRVVDGSRILQEPVRGRDGESLKKAPSTPSSPLAGCKLLRTRYAADKKIEEWEKPDGSIVENWVLVPATGWTPAGLHGRPTRAELAARHHQHEAPANASKPSSLGLPMAGLAGPNGIRQDTSGAESWHNRLLLKDF